MDNYQIRIKAFKALLIILALLIALLLNSCMSYNKAKTRYARTVVDTLTVTKKVTVTIPKDSVKYQFVTDTVPFYREIQQGRAKIQVQYQDRIVKIKADCDSTTKTETVTLKTPQEINTWGASPIYEKGFFVLCGLFMFAVFHIIVTHKKQQ
jgi:PBP1b-binding outer membrane lipoprotein LpoB